MPFHFSVLFPLWRISCRMLLPAGSCLLVLLVTSLAQAQDEKEIPPPEEVSIPTKDGVLLKATFYPGSEGKKSVPVILVHDYKGNRNELNKLALVLQKQGSAVLVPDMRGHGDSTKVLLRGNQLREIDVSRFRPSDFGGMVTYDMEAVKIFLRDKNDKGDLNINSLCILGIGMGAVVATNYAALDWSWPVLATGKQGQDVRGLVLISPDWTFKGLNMIKPLKAPGVPNMISYLLVVGKQKSTALQDSKKIHKMLERFHPVPPPDEAAEKKSLFFQEIDTNLQGIKLLANPNLGIDGMVAQFVDLRLIKKEFPWSERGSSK